LVSKYMTLFTEKNMSAVNTQFDKLEKYLLSFMTDQDNNKPEAVKKTENTPEAKTAAVENTPETNIAETTESEPKGEITKKVVPDKKVVVVKTP